MSMPNSRKIQELQNKKENLIIQAASGHYYNLAEYINYGWWILSILSAIVSLWSNEVVFTVIMIGIDLLIMFCSTLVKRYTSHAADLRELFDYHVLLDSDKNSMHSDNQKLRELAVVYSLRFKKRCEQQINNTGSDNPPGKKDWYSFNEEYDSLQAQIICIEQNKWWGKELKKYRYGVIAIIHVITIAAFVAYFVLHPGIVTVVAIINALCIIIFRYVERVAQYFKYYTVSIRAETAFEIVKEHPSSYGIVACMKYVNDYRHIPIFEMSIVHSLLAKKLTFLYKKISEK